MSSLSTNDNLPVTLSKHRFNEEKNEIVISSGGSTKAANWRGCRGGKPGPQSEIIESQDTPKTVVNSHKSS